MHGRTCTTICVPATQPLARLPADSYYQARISLDTHIMLFYHAMQLQISTIFLGTFSKLSIDCNGSFLSPLFQNQNKERGDVFSRLKGRLGPPISHLLFANDNILFAKSNTRSVDALCSTSDVYCHRSQSIYGKVSLVGSFVAIYTHYSLISGSISHPCN